MTVFRTIHNRENPYVLVNKASARDSSLSLRARGLLVMCMSYPDDWTFHIKNLVQQCKEGRDCIYATVNELIEARYCIKFTQPIRKNGRIHGNHLSYHLYEFKLTEEEKEREIEKFKESLRQTAFQDPGMTVPENTDLLSNEAKLSNEVNNLPLLSPSVEPPEITKPPAKKRSLRSEEDVKTYAILEDKKLTAEEKKRVTKKYTEEQVTKAVGAIKKLKPKNGYIALLLDALKNPINYVKESKNDHVTPQLEMALLYNEKIRKLFPKRASDNDINMCNGFVELQIGSEWERLSLESDYFDDCISGAMKKIDKYLQNRNSYD